MKKQAPKNALPLFPYIYRKSGKEFLKQLYLLNLNDNYSSHTFGKNEPLGKSISGVLEEHFGVKN